ncbi:MAG: NAD-dependent epimerase/dehydratase family protein [Synechococcus sp.]
MAVRFGIVGCGYVGSAVAKAFRSRGVELTGTITRPERLGELCSLVDHPRIFRAGDVYADVSFLDRLDGLLVAVAPRSGHYCLDQYDAVYRSGMTALASALERRCSSSPLHVTYLSSAGVYGDQRGEVCPEDRLPDLRSAHNAALVSAEQALLNVRSSSVQTVVLRLGGIYGPNQDIPSMIRSAAGQTVAKNGDHINAWVHRDDIVRGVAFAFDQRLRGTYNLVDDLTMSRREISHALCDRDGLPPVLWESHDRPGARIFNARVSNARLKALGFKLAVPSMLKAVPAC